MQELQELILYLLRTFLCNKHASSSCFLDLLLSPFAEEASFYNDGLFRKNAFAENFEVSLSKHLQVSLK